MKNKNGNFLICITILLLICGFVIPGLTATLQDSYLENRIGGYELLDIEFGREQQENSPTHALRAAASLYHHDEKIKIQYSNLEVEQTSSDVDTFIAFFDSFFPDAANWGKWIETHYIAVQGDTVVGSSYWYCSVYRNEVAPDNFMGNILLENETRKVVAFYLVTEQTDVGLWAQLLRDYYAFADYAIEPLSTSEYRITFSDWDGESVTVALILPNGFGFCNFNFYY